ncbi:CNH domain-containing protein [Favolaschia claudopus]|uniref:CNH domain-containing protein n=1 Tax=Favolaschia claudopus TaxID=2862362 RepID=A0AAW0BHT7_9AGAR
MPLDQKTKLFDFPALASLRAKATTSRENLKSPIYSPPPIQQWQSLPTEIFERILDFLHADKDALIICSTVCRAWFPTSRYHLYTLLPVVPDLLVQQCPKVNSAVALPDDSVLYGTNNGISISRDGKLTRVVKLQSVSQIDALPTHNLLFVLSGRRLLIGSLSLATTSTPSPHPRFTVFSTDVSFFRIGNHLGKTVVCIVHAGRFTSHFKLLEVAASSPQPTLHHLRSFYLPDRAGSVHIWNKTIGAGLRTAGFQCVDPVSLVTFAVPVDGINPVPPTTKKCRAMFRVDGDRFLLCYDRCAFYMNKMGQSFEADFAIRWEEPAKQFALSSPYLLAFGASALRVWRIDTGVRAQTVHGAHIRLLSLEPRIVVKMGDGRILALNVEEPYVASVMERTIQGHRGWSRFRSRFPL